MERIKIRWIAGTATFVLIAFAGCLAPAEHLPGEELSRGPGMRLGKLKLMTAARMDVDRTDFTVESIRITITGIAARNLEGTFYRFPVEPFELDLIALEDGLSAVLSRVKIPDGRYDHVRLRTAEFGEIRYADGSTQDLRVPSGSTSGLKVFFEPALTVTEEHLTVALLEVDVLSSLVLPPPVAIFKPVLRVRTLGPVLPPPSDDDGEGEAEAEDENEGSEGDDEESGEADPSEDDDGLIDEDDENDDLFVPVFGV